MVNHIKSGQLSGKLLESMHNQVRTALEEDIAGGDLTAQLISAGASAHASIISRESAVVCGIPWAESCFRHVSPDIRITWLVNEGDKVYPGQALCNMIGNARALLTAERCALNFLQTLSATASQTREFVNAIAGTRARIFDTRKTLPGLRLAQKYAVTVGGGMNQRMGLYDGILIKENHIAAAGSIEAVLQAAKKIGRGVSIQIEVENLEQLQTALTAGATLILLDNFSLTALRDAVSLNAGRAILEASGGIDIGNVREVALTGIDRISIGSITKHVRAIDLSMRFQSQDTLNY